MLRPSAGPVQAIGQRRLSEVSRRGSPRGSPFSEIRSTCTSHSGRRGPPRTNARLRPSGEKSRQSVPALPCRRGEALCLPVSISIRKMRRGLPAASRSTKARNLPLATRRAPIVPCPLDDPRDVQLVVTVARDGRTMTSVQLESSAGRRYSGRRATRRGRSRERIRRQPHRGGLIDGLEVDVEVVLLFRRPHVNASVCRQGDKAGLDSHPGNPVKVLTLAAGGTGARLRTRTRRRGRAPRSAGRRPPATPACEDGGQAGRTARGRGEPDSFLEFLQATFRSAMCWKRRPGSLRRHRADDPLELPRHLGSDLLTGLVRLGESRPASTPPSHRQTPAVPSSSRTGPSRARRCPTVSTFLPSPCSGDM